MGDGLGGVEKRRLTIGRRIANMTPLFPHISQNVAAIRERIATAAARSGRCAEDVRLVAVTKYVGPEEIHALVAAGCTDLGESRSQQLWNRAGIQLPSPDVRWHMIGHLQRNKVERTLPLVSLVHSVDSLRLAEAINSAAKQISLHPRPSLPGIRGEGPGVSAAELQSPTPSWLAPNPTTRVHVLFEVNTSGEPAKHGFTPDELERELPTLTGLNHLAIDGLMCMAGLQGDAAAARRDFAMLRTLRDRLQATCPTGVRLTELSMGMSGDFEIAIDEGATIVRIGSALFEK